MVLPVVTNVRMGEIRCQRMKTIIPVDLSSNESSEQSVVWEEFPLLLKEYSLEPVELEAMSLLLAEEPFEGLMTGGIRTVGSSKSDVSGPARVKFSKPVSISLEPPDTFPIF